MYGGLIAGVDVFEPRPSCLIMSFVMSEQEYLPWLLLTLGDGSAILHMSCSVSEAMDASWSI